ncbi:hypothetical protein ACIP6V_23865 [Streptomyces sp. NPDC088770]|uniref:hypothetical protein n=1 Tax=unclassified Streptomyces TaxID=2593676 RepID=UPI002DD86DBA|nr:hypothetical protein [Streptomyces sp. NBC_01788]WSB29714.1 hypothetical protein OIE49_29630 [Streptomyces sp. NBC_01788]
MRDATPVILAAALTACDSSPQAKADSKAPAAAHHYTTGQDIADDLKAAGFTVTKPRENTDGSYIADVGGTAYDFTVTDKTHQPAPGDAGINLFPNPEALKAWIPLSKSFGGVAVTGDTWAVSLPTTSKTARTDSQRLAPKVAEALDGTVQQ